MSVQFHHGLTRMRTTLKIDADILNAARQGFPVFQVSKGAALR